MRGRPMPLGLRLAYWFADQVLFKPLRDQLGFLRLRRAYTGGAALGPDVFRFFHAIGVNLKQVYGQTEIIGIAFVHRDGDVRHDTVGLPIPGTEVRISEAGDPPPLRRGLRRVLGKARGHAGDLRGRVAAHRGRGVPHGGRPPGGH